MLLKFLSFFLKQTPCHFQANQLNSFALSLLFQHCSKAWTKEDTQFAGWVGKFECSYKVGPVINYLAGAQNSCSGEIASVKPTYLGAPFLGGPQGPLLITSTNPPCKDSFRGWCCSPRILVFGVIHSYKFWSCILWFLYKSLK